MYRAVFILIMTITTLCIYKVSTSAATCLPTLEVPENYLICKVAGDCAVYSDACRSCGNLVVVNKRFEEKLKKKDYQLRNETQCMTVCEGCDTSKARVACQDQKCKLLSSSN